MTRHPFDSGELGRNDPEIDRLGEGLERYATDVDGEPPVDLASRIRAALDDERVPAGGWWRSLLAAFAPWHGPARLALGGAVVAVAVIGALALGDLADRARNNTGSTPSPSVIVSPSPTPTLTRSPTPTPSPTPTLTPSPTPIATQLPTPLPTPLPTDDHGGDSETPSPTGSDNSGPGGGNSGPGGGG
ncbi:MAG: hypothetical protein QOI85_1494 [Chloroflexota bacterium]|jgi:hypothetical protein|nr:hypothetical protein [Chloroflexota bacterium]